MFHAVFQTVRKLFDPLFDRDHPNRARQKRALWTGFFAVLAPILILLGFQYRWLKSLGDQTAMVKMATDRYYSEWFTRNIDLFYNKSAELALELPASYLDEEPNVLKKFFLKRTPKESRPPEKGEDGKLMMQKGVVGARLLFVQGFTNNVFSKKVYLFDPIARETARDVPKDLLKSVEMACKYWELMALNEDMIDTGKLVVDERNPKYPLIMNPIPGENGALAGIAGMVADIDFFKDKLMPAGLRELLGEREDPYFVIKVLDPWGQKFFAEGNFGHMSEDWLQEMAVSPSFVFTDWKVAMGSDYTTLKQLANKNFYINLTLAAMLALTIVGGAGMALRAASREMKLSEMKNDFVSNVSHELRTPVASIRVFGELLRLGRVEEPGKVKEYGEYIETEGRRLTQLINNILDFSKIESGQKEYDLRETHIEEVLDRVLKMLEVRLMHSKARVDYRSPDVSPPPIMIDGDAIAQAVCNLLDNAVKYSDDSPEITVALETRDESLVISVADKGIGIPPEELDKVFDRFHRVSTGLIHNVKGSGLGLALVKHIVNAHGGEVSVDSKVGKGSVFTIDLPLKSGASPAIGRKPTPGAETKLGEQSA